MKQLTAGWAEPGKANVGISDLRDVGLHAISPTHDPSDDHVCLAILRRQAPDLRVFPMGRGNL